MMKALDELGTTLRPPRPIPDMAIIVLTGVCRSRMDAMLKAFDRDREMTVISPGQIQAGKRYRTVFVTYDTMREIERDRARFQWFRDSVVSRLTQDGKIIELP